MSDSSRHRAGAAGAVEVIVLAAGAGTRMNSARPKVLQTLAGQPLLQHVLDTVNTLTPARIHIVIGHGADQVLAEFDHGDPALNWVRQTEQLGTGHAVSAALPDVDDASVVVVAYGDVPLVSGVTLADCAAQARRDGVSLVTADFDDPAQLGRIVRGAAGNIERIVEFKGAPEEIRAITEINSGIIGAQATLLKELCAQVTPNDISGEYYLTDVIELAVQRGVSVQGLVAGCAEEVFGVNDRGQLSELERFYQGRQAQALLQAGVTLADPARLDVRGNVSAGRDSFIDVNVVLAGEVTIGERVHIGAGSVISDSVLANGVTVQPNCVIEGARIGNNAIVGPFAHLRPGADLAAEVKLGNFVEVKNSTLGRGSKASHLAYLGDTTIGAGTNIGAGAITCNYDGETKHPTKIGDGVFVGTNTTLVAPLIVEDGAYIAAGSTVTKTVREGELAVGRSKQRNIKRWPRPGGADK